VNTLHVIKEVVAAWETMALYRTLAIAEVAKVRSRTMAMHAMCLALVAEETGGGGELNSDASLLVAAERLQVRVHVLTTNNIRIRSQEEP
jgi:hypothetical protein